jgi:hypothetical protein
VGIASSVDGTTGVFKEPSRYERHPNERRFVFKWIITRCRPVIAKSAPLRHLRNAGT